MAYTTRVIPQGFSQATAAMQHALAMAHSGRGFSRSRRKRAKAGTSKRRRRSASRRTPGRSRRAGKAMRLVKGSAAAKRYMAKIRRMRR